MTKKVQEKNGRDDFQLRVTRSGSSQAFRRSAESCVNEIARNEFRGRNVRKADFLSGGLCEGATYFPPRPIKSLREIIFPTPYGLVKRFSNSTFAEEMKSLEMLRKLPRDRCSVVGFLAGILLLIPFVLGALDNRDDGKRNGIDFASEHGFVVEIPLVPKIKLDESTSEQGVTPNR
jgi:hypothetical protein